MILQTNSYALCEMNKKENNWEWIKPFSLSCNETIIDVIDAELYLLQDLNCYLISQVNNPAWVVGMRCGVHRVIANDRGHWVITGLDFMSRVIADGDSILSLAKIFEWKLFDTNPMEWTQRSTFVNSLFALTVSLFYSCTGRYFTHMIGVIRTEQNWKYCLTVCCWFSILGKKKYRPWSTGAYFKMLINSCSFFC